MLGKDLAMETFESEHREKERAAGRWFEQEIRAFGGGGIGEEKDGWKDKWEFEVEEQQQEGDEGKNVDDEVDVGGGVGEDGPEIGEDGMPRKIDKEERKRRKKERRKEEKRAKTTKD